MRRQPLRRTHLIVPADPARAIRRKLDVIRWVSRDEILRLTFKRFDITIGEIPLPKNSPKVSKVCRISNCFVRAERHIEFSASIKPAKTIKASAIQIIEELRCFGCT